MIYEQDKKGIGYVPRGIVLAVHVLITIISFKAVCLLEISFFLKNKFQKNKLFFDVW